MCLAVPGKVLEITTTGSLKMGKVGFGGVQKDICLEWLPEVSVGDYVIVHVGFALSKIDEAEAIATLNMLKDTEGWIDADFHSESTG